MFHFRLFCSLILIALPPALTHPPDENENYGFIPEPPKQYDLLSPIPFLFSGCESGCHCKNKASTSMYFADPKQEFVNTSRPFTETDGTVIAIVTPWIFHYDTNVKLKMEGQGFKSVPALEGNEQTCGWQIMRNVSKQAVQRGSIEWWAKGNDTKKAPSTEQVDKIERVMRDVYPTVEITLICVLSLGPIWFSLLVWFTLYCCFRFRWRRHWETARGNRYGNGYGFN